MAATNRVTTDTSGTTRPWHALPQETVFAELEADATGLDAAGAARRLERYGHNRLPEARPRGPLMCLLAQFHNLLIYVLLGAALIAGAMGHWVDTAVILGVVLVNAVIGFVQEGKAEDALAAIRNMLSSQAIGLRDGRHVALPAEQLVPGDVVLLQSGDKVPADLRLFRGKGLQIQEAMLSGFLLWRIVLVSVLMAAGVFGIFGWSSTHGSTLEEARTYAVNTLVVMEVFYLFSVRYLRAPSFTLGRLFNSRAVLIAVATVVVLQLRFTYAPFMERFFDTRPVDFVHGLEILGLGVALFVILELEKRALQRGRAKRGRRQ